MTFAFAFSGDDIEDDINGADTIFESQISSQLEKTSIEHSDRVPAALKPAKKHTLLELLQSLPSQISYNLLRISSSPLSSSSPADQNRHENSDGAENGQNPTSTKFSSSKRSMTVPRRSLFDIRQQLMTEVNPELASSESESLLSGLEQGDLTTGIYEGGFKTWECSLDLASLVLSERYSEFADAEKRFSLGSAFSKNLQTAESQRGGTKNLHIIEIGAGSAIPSLVALQRILLQRRQENDENKLRRWEKVRFTLCDYNEDVLRLCTAVNLFLTMRASAEEKNLNGQDQLKNQSAGDETVDAEEMEVDQDLEDIDEATINTCLQGLNDNGISVDFVSGAWGHEFSKLVQSSSGNDARSTQTLVLASETIYSPNSISIFSDVLFEVLRRDPSNTEALVAAKKVYFGVGGGVQDFMNEVIRSGGRAQPISGSEAGAGVGRVTLRVAI